MPTAESVLNRERLFAKLDKARNSQIIWITGPGGAGKTVLASTYLERCLLKHIWYQLDAGDNDPAAFFFYMGMAGRQVAPRSKRDLPLLTAEFLPSLAEFSRNFFAEIFSRLKSPAFIVIDDYHLLNQDDTLHSVILAALDRIPQGISFLVLSRQDPPPAFIKLKVNRRLASLNWEDLRLTPEECREIIAMEGKEADCRLGMEALCESIGGWAAGLRLLLDAGELDAADDGWFNAGSHEATFDYFAGEIFLNIHEDARDFLLSTSFFPQMSSRMARQFTGNEQAEVLLRNLVRRNQFTEQRPASGQYRYHPLFQVFLQSQAERHFTKGELIDLKRRTAGVLLAEGMTEQAATLSISVEDWPGLEGIILRQAPALFKEGRSQTLERWITALPVAIVRAAPWLQFWQGMCRLFFDQAASRKLLSQAYRQFKQSGDGQGAYLAWAAVVESYAHEWDNLAPLDDWIAEMDELRQRFPDYPSPEVEMRVATCMFVALAYRKPGHPALDLWRQRSEELVFSAPDLPQRLLLGCNHFLYCFWTGNPAKQSLILTALGNLPLKKRQLAHTPYLIILRCLELVHYNLFDTDEEKMLSKEAELERLVTGSGLHLFDHKILHPRIYHCFLTGNHAPLPGLLAKLAALIEHLSTERGHLSLLQGWHALNVRKEHGLALEFLKAAQRLNEEAGFWFFLGPSHCALGHLYTMAGDYRQAAFHLEQCGRIGESSRSDLLLYHYLLFSANLAFIRDEEEQGLALLRQALAMAREKGFLAPFMWWHPETMANLCARALTSGIESGYARHLIRRYRLRPAAPPMEIEQWPWPLKIYTLGRFELVKDDQPLHFASRSQQKPLLLLKMLIALGGRRIHENHVAELLWPEADGDMQHQNFRTTLHRLRKLLDLPEAILYQEGRLTLDPHCCWVDAWSFERQATQAEKTGKHDQEKAARFNRKAIRLYQGAFMNLEEEGGWLLPRRERLYNRFLGQVETLGRYYRQKGEWREAVDLYWQALRFHPLTESLYREIITCQMASGNRAEAVRVLAAARETFHKLLGSEPVLQGLPPLTAADS